MGGKHGHNGHPKLAQSDVRAIFECMHDIAPPPEHLKFTIVPVGPTGQKISPPSYEFEDGLYVLLKPMKKPKKKDSAWKAPTQPPEHLKHLIWKELPPENCPWSLSGPQFEDRRRNAVQQRYCYPKGDPEYSRFKGGAVWTIYYADNKESEEFRLLHVYHSKKRASNNQGKSKKRRKRTRTTTTEHEAMTPPRSLTSAVSYATSPLSTASVAFQSPTATNDTESMTTVALESPLSTAEMEETSVPSTFWPMEQPIVTPINDILPRTPPRGDQETDCNDDDMSSLQSQSANGYGGCNLSPFRRSTMGSAFGINICKSPLQRTGEYRSILPDDKDGLLDYVPPPDDLRSILTEPIMSYDDDEDSVDDASCLSGLEALREKSDDLKLTEPGDTLAEWERKLPGGSLMDAFDEVEFRAQMSMPYFVAPLSGDSILPGACQKHH